MPSTPITGSSNIAILDSRLVADLCVGKFFVDLTPSTFIGNGDDNMLGARVQIVNPYGVEIKPFQAGVYDIAAPFDSVFEFPIPTQAGNFQYGRYEISVEITDAGGTRYTVKKSVDICVPNPKDKTKNFGTLDVIFRGICKDSKVYVSVAHPPTYKNKLSSTSNNTFTLTFPSGGLDPLPSAFSSFSVQLFEGEYKLVGESCVEYAYGDNVFYMVKYKVNGKKNILCGVDECCVFAKLSELNLRMKADCTDKEKEASMNITLDALRLLKTAQLAEQCGEDASEYIAELEALLGCKCTCGCNEGTPVINSTPAGDVLIEGCNINRQEVGLTTVYTIENFTYILSIAENGGALTVGAPFLDGTCTMRQVITFDIQAVYNQIINIAGSDANNANQWTSIINNALNNISNVTGLGVTQEEWNAMTFAQRFQTLVDAINACCGCDAVILTSQVVQHEGNSAKISWTQANAASVDVFLDNQYVTTITAPANQYIFYGISNGEQHTYELVPKCENGKTGTSVDGEFNFFGCPAIAPVVVSTQNANNVPCPYNLTQLVSALPAGVVAEYHTQNNTNASSLVANPQAVTSGIYYIFARDSNGCYSIGTSVQVVCLSTSCSAPQNLTVKSAMGGFLVQFQSAAFPPPNNSYTVKRRLASDPDQLGSYTTIGTPVWNSTTSRWEILDTTGQDNVDYVYVAISNCGSTQPTIETTFSNYTSCPIVTGVVVTIS